MRPGVCARCCCCFLRTPPPNPAPPPRSLWQKIAGYESASDVEQHSKIDLDMQEFEDKVGEYDTNANWITEAMFIYENGGNGLCMNANDNGIGCAAGEAWGNSLKSSSIRTLKGFATKDYAALTGDYAEKLPPIYTAYWTKNGMTAAEAAIWADTFVRKDYSAISKDAGSNQLMKKGANYQAVWMYVLHELEDAIGDCKAGDITANDCTPSGGSGACGNAPHAWDEGWAFYAGSQVAATAADSVTDDGTLIWELAEKRGSDFNTQHSTGPATVNVNLLAEFIAGRDLIINAKCTEAEPIIDNIITQMSIPLIQGTLKYAYNSDPKTTTGYCTADAAKTALTSTADCAKAWAEGWAFAAAILPRIDQCSASAPARAAPEFSFTSRDLTLHFSRRRRPRSNRTSRSRRRRRWRAASRRSRRRWSRRTRAWASRAPTSARTRAPRRARTRRPTPPRPPRSRSARPPRPRVRRSSSELEDAIYQVPCPVPTR